ncbi:hypothetical protein GGP79_001109 [Salinibacter ruber]|uniref:hypothetical protein n=1 Tax=Salinibacter ruber TaxID=146919 RepID=UPI0021678BBB|nr:hypothetical protein [Salinibacter ruber]MCS3753164.1 hypothetical protein [Salinibacter ruber]
MANLVKKLGALDIVIDDISHVNSHVVTSFKFLFRHLNNGGWYVVEDLQSAYWEEFGGKPRSEVDSSTSVGFFKSLVDGLNFEEFEDDEYEPNYFDRHITEIHFYHNMVFIRKGINNDGSNVYGDRFW